MDLFYRGTKDCMNKNTFYDKCQNKGLTIVLINNKKGNIFGWYASIYWLFDIKEEKKYSAPDSFLFTLTNIYNIQPTKFPSKNDQSEIRCYFGNGPLFGIGTDLGLYRCFFKWRSLDKCWK